MESQRTVLFFAFCLLSFMLWDAWHKDFAQHPATQSQDQISEVVTDVPEMVSKKISGGAKLETAGLDQKQINKADILTVKTDVFNIQIDKLGGDFIDSELLKYPVSVSDKNSLKLLNSQEKSFYLAPNGLASDIGPDTTQERAKYTSEKNNFVLEENQKELTVPLVWSKNGIKVEKTFIFTRGSYLVKIKYNIQNNSQKTWEGYSFAKLKRKKLEEKGSMFGFKTFVGPAWYTPDSKFKTFAFDKLKTDPQNADAKNGWIAMIEQYFVSAWIPPKDEEYNYKLNTQPNDVVAATLTGPEITVKKGENKTISFDFYSGPEISDELTAAAPHLDRSIDFGVFWPISSLLLSIMKFFHKFLINWGLSIIAVTVLIKLVFYKMSASSYRSMAKMKKIQPKIEQLKQRYGDDKQKIGVAMMELYKKEKVSPLGGCLPMLIQMPFFLGFYWAIVESVELRQAPFFLWIKDLSIPDPYFVLPIIMGVTMLLQQKLSPQSYQDETQQKVMMAMPIVFTFMFLYFPAGLVLYWTVNNGLSILQQWFIMKQEGV